MAARTRGTQEADAELFQDESSSDANDATNDLPRPRRSIQESESETDSGDAATNNPILIRNKSGTLLIEDKDTNADDYPAKDNPPQNRNNSGLVLIEAVESESDGQPSSNDLFPRQPSIVEELDSDGNIATNDPPVQNQPMIEEDLLAKLDDDSTRLVVNLIRLREFRNLMRHYLLLMNESEIEDDSETERHEGRGPVEAQRHFYECTLRSVRNKIREAVVVAVTHDPDHARSAAFRSQCEGALAVYENARQDIVDDDEVKP